jgi:hypothetical protein
LWSLKNKKSLIVNSVFEYLEYWFRRIATTPLCFVYKYFNVIFTEIFCSERYITFMASPVCESAHKICDPSIPTSYSIEFREMYSISLTSKRVVSAVFSVT